MHAFPSVLNRVYRCGGGLVNEMPLLLLVNPLFSFEAGNLASFKTDMGKKTALRRFLGEYAEALNQAATASFLRGPLSNAKRMCSMTRSSSPLVMPKCGVKRSELVPP